MKTFCCCSLHLKKKLNVLEKGAITLYFMPYAPLVLFSLTHPLAIARISSVDKAKYIDAFKGFKFTFCLFTTLRYLKRKRFYLMGKGKAFGARKLI